MACLRRTDGRGHKAHEEHKGHEDFGIFVILVNFVAAAVGTSQARRAFSIIALVE